MFKLYKLENIVKNKALLKSFYFTIENYQGFRLLCIEKKQSAKPILFYVNLDHSYDYFHNLLRQPFFPSSTTILSKLGKKVVDSTSDIQRRRETACGRHLPFLSNTVVKETIIRYFRYKNISFNTYRGSVQCKTKENAVINHDNQNHILIDYFRNVTSKGIYEEDVFKALYSLFDTVDNDATSINQMLKSIKYVDDQLKYRSLFAVPEEGEMFAVNYGKALEAAQRGLPVLYGDLDWDSFLKRRESSEEILQPLDLSPRFSNVFSSQLERFQNSREKVLTSEAASHYNREIPDLVYWNA